jgi:DNA polymerase-3 subunit alpha
VVEALVQCGAFDSVHARIRVSRAQASAAVDAALEQGRKRHAERLSGQTSLLGLLDDPVTPKVTAPATFPSAEPWDTRELLAREKNVLGFYVSGHPLDRSAKELKRFCNATVDGLTNMPEGEAVTVGGSVEAYRERTTKAGGRIAFFSLEDSTGRVEVVVRPRVLEAKETRKILGAGEPVLVTGSVQRERSRAALAGAASEDGDTPVEVKLVLDEVAPLSESLRKRTRSVRVTLGIERLHRQQLVALRQTLERFPGSCPVTLALACAKERWSVSAGTGLCVEPSDALLASLERLFGENVCELR